MVLSPVATGNGAFVVHSELAERLSDYTVLPYSPKKTLFPPSLWPIGRDQPVTAVHTTPDYAVFHAHRNVPLIVTFHGYAIDKGLDPYSSLLQRVHGRTDLRWFHRLAVNRADVITAVSHFTANLAKSDMGLKKPIEIIYNGVDEQKFIPAQLEKRTKEVRVLFSGNLTRRKGAHWLLPIIQKLDENVSIYYTSGLREQSGLVSHPRLLPLGRIPYEKMPDLYREMDILLFPTVREGLSLAVLEAMASGLPIVASDVASLPEQVAHGKGGYLCSLGDVDAFCEAIQTLADNPALRREMGEFNRSEVEQRFRLLQMVERYQRLFESMA